MSKSGSAAADVAKQWADPPWKGWGAPPDFTSYKQGGFTGATYGGAQASGGDYIVTKPTLFLAGEAGTERVTFAPISGGGGASSRPIIITVYPKTYLDGRELAQNQTPYIVQLLPNELLLAGR